MGSRDPVPIVQDTGWAPGLAWMGAENLTPTGIKIGEHFTFIHLCRGYAQGASVLTEQNQMLISNTI